MLLRIRKFRRRGKKEKNPEEEIETEILGHITTTFKFNNLADFQYLPMEKSGKEHPDPDDPDEYEFVSVQSEARVGKKKKKSGHKVQKKRETIVEKNLTRVDDNKNPEYRSLLDQVYFHKLEESQWIEQEKNGTLFLPPPAFSRMDVPQDYHFRREVRSLSSAAAAQDSQSEKNSAQLPYNIIGRTRQRRSLHAIFVTFDVEKVPREPSAVALNHLKVKFVDKANLETVKELFRDVPIWSKNGLSSVTGLSAERLKYIVPAVAYYFISGPWRNMWVRFDYDPRSDPEAGPLQTLDYRVRLKTGIRNLVKAKRSSINYQLPYKTMSSSKPKSSVIDQSAASASSSAVSSGESADNEQKELARDKYQFRANRTPPFRQMFYQYKDILVEHAQELIAKSRVVDPGTTKTCNEKHGWYIPGLDNQLRDILTECINKNNNS